jgi:hypothetical protein
MAKKQPEKQGGTGREANGRFAKGASGNPAGRPPSKKFLSESLREWLGAPSDEDPAATNSDILAAAAGKAALLGSIPAIEFIADRTEGRAPSKLDLTYRNDDATLREDALKFFAEYVTAFGGDEEAARLQFLADCPTMGRYIN